jgi:hypothetical protein
MRRPIPKLYRGHHVLVADEIDDCSEAARPTEETCHD